ncbi:bifunctional metallophosphatase/5'-nucleotidase [Paenilisteria rocourtiae]|uniref:2',3'-cyclic-nucleotide 2'-phosphodiesterase (5'-nucleotidase family) n=1 Tax=Listeria rocourtiae TaxID=647910 RepID=A0A4R6ZGF4_9LIST|nr:bifunctional UDP-sugar hydrolase/5'-nucleotidase [Listeria rocourtiae]EUJ43061.1 Ser/Thr protein phosphatase family protein [Listeria rocourtiae FSL F6-920]MBC1436530.1 bifunctional metallophosphatase/5'-nucleotidase [Listeria rocourtiae]MBC1605624.1 bifunctional metallophosphatase/5'-nucleotidase [Listeria rocourtiae]TDR51341.1 2',3'-cyclic-nucleotide 2'-phosphodiesterase (5'-nucleotidase family) [Listeria rocourtiae]
MKRLTIWHTNDIHSHLEKWPRIFTFLREKRLAMQGDLFFDIGDFIDRMHPYTEGSMGQGNVALLNALPYDAVTIGNNEGAALGHAELAHLYDDAVFPVVCCNVYEDQAQTELARFAKGHIYIQQEGVKIAIIGATACFTEYYESLGWGIEEPIQAIKREVSKVQADVTILLSHLGLPLDEKIATEIPEIDLILGGHTHHLLEHGKEVDGTLLAAAGRWGEYVGEVTLEFDEIAGRLVSKQARVHAVSDFPAPVDEENQIKAFREQGEAELSQKVVALPHQLEHNWFKSSEISELFHEAACEWTGADTFLTNAGIYMTDLPTGIVTAYDIHQLLPHPLNFIVLSMTGIELGVLIQEIAEKESELRDIPLRGFGFRGEVFGAILTKRMTFDVALNVALWDGAVIEPDKIYRIATHDTFVYAPFFPIIKRVAVKEVYTPELLRDVMTWKLKEKYDEGGQMK